MDFIYNKIDSFTTGMSYLDTNPYLTKSELFAQNILEKEKKSIGEYLTQQSPDISYAPLKINASTLPFVVKSKEFLNIYLNAMQNICEFLQKMDIEEEEVQSTELPTIKAITDAKHSPIKESLIRSPLWGSLFHTTYSLYQSSIIDLFDKKKMIYSTILGGAWQYYTLYENYKNECLKLFYLNVKNRIVEKLTKITERMQILIEYPHEEKNKHELIQLECVKIHFYEKQARIESFEARVKKNEEQQENPSLNYSIHAVKIIKQKGEVFNSPLQVLQRQENDRKRINVIRGRR